MASSTLPKPCSLRVDAGRFGDVNYFLEVGKVCCRRKELFGRGKPDEGWVFTIRWRFHLLGVSPGLPKRQRAVGREQPVGVLDERSRFEGLAAHQTTSR